MSKTIVIKPRTSEKAYALSEERNTYVFVVDGDVNRLAVAEAVESQYEVGVVSVRMASNPSKTKRTYKRRGRVVHKGTKSGIRKAYVTLAEGDKLPIFAAVENTDPTPDKGKK